MITITALFHPARHWRRRHARGLGSDSLGRSRRRNRGGGLIARRIFENDIEIADPHRMLHHGSQDRKSTRLNSSHGYISYAVFCLKKKKKKQVKTEELWTTLHIHS